MKRTPNHSSNKSKKVWLIPLIIVLVIAVAVGGYFGYQSWQSSQAAQRRQAQAEDLTEEYLAALRQVDMESFVPLLSESSISDSANTREEIGERYQTIFSAIGAGNLMETQSTLTLNEETDQYEFSYTLSMDTSLGKLEDLEYQTTFTETEEEMFVDWQPSLIFPDMAAGDTVRIASEEGDRGNINDRNGNMLAGNGSAWQAGLYPAMLGEGNERQENIAAIAEAFETEVSELETLLEQSWVTEESLVPITVVQEGDRPELTGVRYTQTEARMYPLGEAAAHLTGYVGEVTAEDIEINPTLITGDVVGKTGLEAALDDRLRGSKGGRIYIESEAGETKTVLIESEAQNGENIRLTIDMNLQQAAYDQFNGEPGSAVVMDPASGELLVAASSPSYDPQLFTQGISAEQYAAYADNPDSPFLTRYSSRYAPGSTFKILTSMIGLDAGTIVPEETHTIEGLDWQPEDGSLGNHDITRVSDAVIEVDLQAAITYSDNIYFAMEALEMGADTFLEGLTQFPFGASMNLPISMQPAQISNDGSISQTALLADTAYGQGETLMSPIHQISFYSSVVNQGSMTFPTLLLEETEPNQLTPVTAESAQIVREALVNAVADENGTAHPFSTVPFPIGAKTGTAEINQDGEIVTNGFVYAFDAQDDSFSFLGFMEGKASGEVVDRFLPILPELKGAE
ncbi:penicillin-binding protein PBP4(5) [Marinilactibacillus piezotolerans]|uniref:penicillin-binding protein PBP4(5) n=1 Tax=Marinilactibacillus piezotolerans TaxID=258723 RepID=UPI0009B0B9E9|nr:penicillin-binding transpeptidase domain-containing protein [Marinilactibacillus piezotolerans]